MHKIIIIKRLTQQKIMQNKRKRNSKNKSNESMNDNSFLQRTAHNTVA